ncbi:pirin family protein [Roseateles amylovorans]|uniref:Pirin family protein n=1 Tax=Roseateles amylovorans TaxID=2978473 RepID=A0ABY6B464_9BURK|nr:pirin family protein [Roseateles amylovorans]UXH80163.1 pirin family protein [Roseateles amylovorans]
MSTLPTRSASEVPARAVRAIVHRTRGQTHGPITRLMSPGDLGQVLKPFIFLDLVNFKAQAGATRFGMHPHSGIATLTFMALGDVRYADSTGKAGVLPAGGVEWMQAGAGVWHTGEPVGDSLGEGFQLWVALPADQENAPAFSQYLAPSEVPQVGPARVLMGRYGAAQSAIEPPSSMTYLALTLRQGERWRYTPPAGHTVAWAAVASGQVMAGEAISAGELVSFTPSETAIDFVAQADTRFVLGSAAPHPHPLVMGTYSVHTSKHALHRGEAEIKRLGLGLQAAGRLV